MASGDAEADYGSAGGGGKSRRLLRVSEFGKMLVVFGLILVGVGLLLLFGSKIPWLGRLPGDITIRRENFTFYFPLATSIVISLVLTFLFWLLRR